MYKCNKKKLYILPVPEVLALSCEEFIPNKENSSKLGDGVILAGLLKGRATLLPQLPEPNSSSSLLSCSDSSLFECSTSLILCGSLSPSLFEFLSEEL